MFYVSDFLVIKYLLTAPEKVHIIQNKHHISFLRKSTELMSARCVINMPVRGSEPQTLVKNNSVNMTFKSVSGKLEHANLNVLHVCSPHVKYFPLTMRW